MKVELFVPTNDDRKKGAKIIAFDDQGDAICASFSNNDTYSDDRFKLLVEQSNQYFELKSAIERMSISHPEIASYFKAALPESGDARAAERAPYAGMYAYSIDRSERFSGNFSAPGEAISQALTDCESEFKKDIGVFYTIGTLTHPISVAYDYEEPIKDLGEVILDLISNHCAEAIGSDESPLAFSEEDRLNIATIALHYAFNNAEVNFYGIAHEITYRHINGTSKDAAAINDIASKEAEYLARATGWQIDLLGSPTQPFKIVKGNHNTDGEDGVLIYADDWFDAVKIDNGLSFSKEEDRSNGMS